MNWFKTLAFTVFLLTFQHDAVSSTASKSLWTDSEKASSFMDCLITKIVESENFPQGEKEDLKSIMDTLMSAINGANAKGKSSGPQMQAINMAIASSLAEIVVAADADNPITIAAKTHDLAEGLEQCFESEMGTIDTKFIGEINDLISMFAKEAASDVQEPLNQGDPSTEAESKPAEKPTPAEDGDQSQKAESIEGETQDSKTTRSDDEPQVPNAESNGEEPQNSDTTPEVISGATNELLNASPRTDLKTNLPQQIIRTAVYPIRSPSSSYRPVSQSSSNTYQSSKPAQDSVQTSNDYRSENRRPLLFKHLEITSEPHASIPAQNGVGPQDSHQTAGFILGDADILADTSIRKGLLGNEVPLQSVSRMGYPNRSFLSSTDTTQSADNLKSSSQGTSQTDSGYQGTYSEPQFSKPTQIDIRLRTLPAATEIISRKASEQEDTSTLRGVNENDNSTPRKANENYNSRQRNVNEKDDTSTKIVVKGKGDDLTRGFVNKEGNTPRGRVVNEKGDVSTRIGAVLRNGIPLRIKQIKANTKGSSYSPFEATSQSDDNTYQSNRKLHDERYGSRNRRPDFFKPQVIVAGPQVSKSTQNDAGSQTTQPSTRRISKIGSERADTSTTIGLIKSGVPQQTTSTAGNQNRSPSSSYETTGQSASNRYQPGQKNQGLSQMAGRNNRLKFLEHTAKADGPQAPNDVGFQAPRGKLGFILREANTLTDESTGRIFQRNGVPQQTDSRSIHSKTPISSTSRTRQFPGNTDEPKQTYQGSSHSARKYGRRNHRPDLFNPSHNADGPQVQNSIQNIFGPKGLKAAPGLISRVADELVDTSTRKTGLRKAMTKQTVSTVAYPSKSSDKTSQTDDQSGQPFPGSSQRTDEYSRRNRKPQLLQTTAIDGGLQALPATPGLISRVVNRQGNISTDIGVNGQGNISTGRGVNGKGNTSTGRKSNDQGDSSTRIGAVLRGGVSQQTKPTADYPKRPYLPSLQPTSQSSGDASYQPSQMSQDLSQTTGGYKRTHSRPRMSQPVQNSNEPQIPGLPSPPNDKSYIVPATPRIDSSPNGQDTFNDRSYNDQSLELSVESTLNSPIGLRSESATVRIVKMISAILNAVGSSGVDVNALARSLQSSVSNLRSSGMSPSDAKLEVLFELIVGLLQIVSNAQVQEINTTTASAMTNAAARCFELALA